MERTYLNTIEAMCDKPTASSTLNTKSKKLFEKDKYAHSPHVHSV